MTWLCRSESWFPPVAKLAVMGLEFVNPRWATAPRRFVMVNETAPEAGSVTLIPSNAIPDPIRLATTPVEMGPDPVSAVRIASTVPLVERWLVIGTERKTYSDSLTTWPGVPPPQVSVISPIRSARPSARTCCGPPASEQTRNELAALAAKADDRRETPRNRPIPDMAHL